MTLETTRYDSADTLDSKAAIVAYLKLSLEEGDAADIGVALNAVARTKGMTEMARESGVTREALDEGLGATGSPTLTTLLAVVRALGVKLSVVA